MKIGILGGDFKLISAILASAGHQAVLVCEDDLIVNDKILVTCGHPLGNIGVNAFPVKPMPMIDNSFRGGSVGKGGKIKYRRT